MLCSRVPSTRFTSCFIIAGIHREHRAKVQERADEAGIEARHGDTVIDTAEEAQQQHNRGGTVERHSTGCTGGGRAQGAEQRRRNSASNYRSIGVREVQWRHKQNGTMIAQHTIMF